MCTLERGLGLIEGREINLLLVWLYSVEHLKFVDLIAITKNVWIANWSWKLEVNLLQVVVENSIK